MQDLKKNRRRINNNNKQMNTMTNVSQEEARVEVEDLERGFKSNNNNMMGQTNKCNENHDKCHEKHDKCHDKKDEFECECHCECKKSNEKCEPCQVESDVCSVNTCREECCNGISPTFSTRNAQPVAIEVNRIFDSIQFRTFTDATGPNGEPLFFDFEVVEVRGNVPTTGAARVTVDEVCMNFSTLEIQPGEVTIDDFPVEEIENDSNCDTVFESIVCPNRNPTCCAQNRGQNVSFRERGLTVIVNDLVLEIRAHCGCTKIVALAFPAVRQMGRLNRVDNVEFRFNTLSSNLCVPSSGRSFVLRQNYNTNLAVDCIANAFISANDCCDCKCDCDDDLFDFAIPSGIDLILCVEETVSVLIGDQVVVLADNNVNPRVVDTFANVCSFPNCGE